MATPKKRKVEDKPKEVNSPYEEIIENEEYYYEPKSKIRQVQFVRDKKTGDKKIKFSKRWVAHRWGKGKKSTWKWHRGSNYYISGEDNIPKIIKILRWFANLLGIRDTEFDELNVKEDSITNLHKELFDVKEELERVKEKEELLSKNLILKESKFEEERNRILLNKMDFLKKDLQEFKLLLNNFKEDKKQEKDLQEFLQNHTWFFGLYYKDFKDQKFAGMGLFDFYLERFDGSYEIIELKRADAKYKDKRDKVSKELVEAIDQMLRYFDLILDLSASKRIGDRLEIREFYPRGTIILGYNPSKDELNYLNRWRYSFRNLIEILSYDHLLKKAEITIRNLEIQNKRLKDKQ